jgi:hypothetical protein
MRLDIPPPNRNLTRNRIPNVLIWPIATGSPNQVLKYTLQLPGAATLPVDYTTWTTTISQTDLMATVRLSLGSNFGTPPVPAPNQVVTISDLSNGVAGIGAAVVFSGVIESVRLTRARSQDLTAVLTVRRRDATPFWRDVKRISSVFVTGTDFGVMATNIAVLAGLSSNEFSLPYLGVAVQHDTVQLANLSLWDMLQAVLAPCISEPFIDGRGFLKIISRDIHRAPVYTFVDNSTIQSINTTSTRSPLNIMRVKYIDPIMVKVRQIRRILIEITLNRDESAVILYYSSDKRQRAELPLLTKFGKFFNSAQGLSAIAPNAILLNPSAISINPFSDNSAIDYAISAIPYDFVQQQQVVDAYDVNAPVWANKLEEFNSSFVPNEDVARTIAVAELCYRSHIVNTTTITMIDDYRFEPGDIIRLADKRQFYVTSYVRNFDRDVSALVELTGFFV